MRYLVAASVVLLALTGCTVDTSAAEKNCGYAILALWQADNPDASSDETLEFALRAAERCSELAAEDPDQFVVDYG